MVHELCRRKPRLVLNFVLAHPEFLPIVKKLAASDNEWMTPRDLKEYAGLATRHGGPDFSNWIQFSNKCKDCGLTEITRDNVRHTLIRVLPGMNEEFDKIAKVVEEE